MEQKRRIVDLLFFFLNKNDDDGCKDGERILAHHERAK
jgi:hypothetical protein